MTHERNNEGAEVVEQFYDKSIRYLIEVPDTFAVARWPRDADVATIARCILGTLKYEPHGVDTTPLRRALESVMDHEQRASSTPYRIVARTTWPWCGSAMTEVAHLPRLPSAGASTIQQSNLEEAMTTPLTRTLSERETKEHRADAALKEGVHGWMAQLCADPSVPPEAKVVGLVIKLLEPGVPFDSLAKSCGMDEQSTIEALQALAEAGWASDLVIFPPLLP